MRLSIRRVRRWPDWPPWAVGVAALWLGLVGAAEWVSRATGTSLVTCLFRRMTGLPCPTCGCTRSGLCLLRGDVWHAITFNPLMFALGALAAAWLGARLVFARQLHFELSRRERRVALVAFLVAVAANWAYVIRFVG